MLRKLKIPNILLNTFFLSLGSYVFADAPRTNQTDKTDQISFEQMEYLFQQKDIQKYIMTSPREFINSKIYSKFNKAQENISNQHIEYSEAFNNLMSQVSDFSSEMQYYDQSIRNRNLPKENIGFFDKIKSKFGFGKKGKNEKILRKLENLKVKDKEDEDKIHENFNNITTLLEAHKKRANHNHEKMLQLNNKYSDLLESAKKVKAQIDQRKMSGTIDVNTEEKMKRMESTFNQALQILPSYIDEIKHNMSELDQHILKKIKILDKEIEKCCQTQKENQSCHPYNFLEVSKKSGVNYHDTSSTDNTSQCLIGLSKMITQMEIEPTPPKSIYNECPKIITPSKIMNTTENNICRFPSGLDKDPLKMTSILNFMDKKQSMPHSKSSFNFEGSQFLKDKIQIRGLDKSSDLLERDHFEDLTIIIHDENWKDLSSKETKKRPKNKLLQRLFRSNNKKQNEPYPSQYIKRLIYNDAIVQIKTEIDDQMKSMDSIADHSEAHNNLIKSQKLLLSFSEKATLEKD